MKKRIIAVVVATIRFKNIYLLTKRVHEDKTWHDKWQLPGGELEPGEFTKACIQRELKEELGISFSNFVKIPLLFEKPSYGKSQSHILLIPYLCTVRRNNFKIKLDDEAAAYGWFTIKQVEQLSRLDGTLEVIKASKRI